VRGPHRPGPGPPVLWVNGPPPGHPALFDREEIVWRGAARFTAVR
jgi:hypothetical protein